MEEEEVMIFIAFGLGVLVILIILELLEAHRLRKENKLLEEENTRLKVLFQELKRREDYQK
ncbi:hypothetical protein C0030_005970 [Candidatus Liberibacter solanacearum]|uniref:Uncharacterized protein n=2 Tax=Candidatus Liberibacter solanacearum TaxID=556287 RepID=A0A424FKW3_9HYPH|nr:hypothetical protein C0030_005970 [Candidatus Liberibacter solanacearum]